MKSSFVQSGFLFLAMIASSGCAALKAAPAADSGFLRGAERMAAHQDRYPFQRVWLADDASSVRWRTIYIAPINVSRALERSDIKPGTPRFTRMEGELRKAAEFMKVSFSKRLGQDTDSPFRLVEAPQPDTLVLELAIVELRPTEVVRSAAGLLVGALLPGGSLLSFRSQGTVAVEGVLRDSATGREVFMFADRERGKVAPFSFNDFTRFSHSRDIIADWADQLTAVCRNPREAKVRDTLPVTLLPI